jgi:hypothetical protein
MTLKKDGNMRVDMLKIEIGGQDKWVSEREDEKWG